jgi:hypothetical protein
VSDTPSIDYPALLRQALLGVVRAALRRAESGLPADHHFYLTFRTDAPGVSVPPGLRRRFPGEMTIVLQHQFWNLVVDEEGFSVTLRFGGAPQRLEVPFEALVSFVDPSVQFGLRLSPTPDEAQATPLTASEGAGAASVAEPREGAAAPSTGPSAASKVVDLQAFRRSGNPDEAAD